MTVSKKQGNNTNVGMYLYIPIINVTAHWKVVKFVIKTSFIL